jgi:hypothetical protein
MSVIVVFDPPNTLLDAMVEAAPLRRGAMFLHPRLLGRTVPVVPAPTVVLLPNAIPHTDASSQNYTATNSLNAQLGLLPGNANVKPLALKQNVAPSEWKRRLESDNYLK